VAVLAAEVVVEVKVEKVMEVVVAGSAAAVELLARRQDARGETLEAVATVMASPERAGAGTAREKAREVTGTEALVGVEMAVVAMAAAALEAEALGAEALAQGSLAEGVTA
jgi:hypothetical protein